MMRGTNSTSITPVVKGGEGKAVAAVKGQASAVSVAQDVAGVPQFKAEVRTVARGKQRGRQGQALSSLKPLSNREQTRLQQRKREKQHKQEKIAAAVEKRKAEQAKKKLSSTVSSTFSFSMSIESLMRLGKWAVYELPSQALSLPGKVYTGFFSSATKTEIPTLEKVAKPSHKSELSEDKEFYSLLDKQLALLQQHSKNKEEYLEKLAIKVDEYLLESDEENAEEKIYGYLGERFSEEDLMKVMENIESLSIEEIDEFEDAPEYEETIVTKRSEESESRKRDVVMQEKVIYEAPPSATTIYDYDLVTFGNPSDDVDLLVITELTGAGLQLVIKFSDDPANKVNVEPTPNGINYLTLQKVGNKYLMAYLMDGNIKIRTIDANRAISNLTIITSHVTSGGIHSFEIKALISESLGVIKFVDTVNGTTGAFVTAIDEDARLVTTVPLKIFDISVLGRNKFWISENNIISFAAVISSDTQTEVRDYQFNVTSNQFVAASLPYVIQSPFIDIGRNNQGLIGMLPSYQYPEFRLFDPVSKIFMLAENFTRTDNLERVYPYRLLINGNDFILLGRNSYGVHKVNIFRIVAPNYTPLRLTNAFEITRPNYGIYNYFFRGINVGDGIIRLIYTSTKTPIDTTKVIYSSVLYTKLFLKEPLLTQASLSCLESSSCDISPLMLAQAPYNPKNVTMEAKIESTNSSVTPYATVACAVQQPNVTVTQISSQELRVTDLREIKDDLQIVACEIQLEKDKNIVNSGALQITFTFTDGGFSPEITKTLPLNIIPVTKTTADRNPAATLPTVTVAQYGSQWTMQIPQAFCLNVDGFTAVDQTKTVMWLNNGMVVPMTINVANPSNGTHIASSAARVSSGVQASDIKITSRFPTGANCSETIRLNFKPSFSFDQLNNQITCRVTQDPATQIISGSLGAAAPHVDEINSVSDLSYVVTATINAAEVAEFIQEANSMFQTSSDRLQQQFSGNLSSVNAAFPQMKLLFKLMQALSIKLNISNGYASQEIILNISPTADGYIVINNNITNDPNFKYYLLGIFGAVIALYGGVVAALKIKDEKTLSSLDAGVAEFLRTLGVYLTDMNIQHAKSAYTSIQQSYTADDASKSRQIQQAPEQFGRDAAIAMESLQRLGSYYDDHKPRALLFFSRRRDLKAITSRDAENIASKIGASAHSSSEEATSSSRSSHDGSPQRINPVGFGVFQQSALTSTPLQDFSATAATQQGGQHTTIAMPGFNPFGQKF